MQRAAAEAGYRVLFSDGTLARRAEEARARLADCDLCARRCRVNRLQTIDGAACRTGVRAIVGGYGAHFGEEAPITGTRGSGTIFFGWCNMRCLYCQNAELSWHGAGQPMSAATLADLMLHLQRQGCHNINLVSPSHVVAQILEALVVATAAGLRLPLVYNTNGYDSPEALALLDGVVDVYMPDMKYASSDIARRYSKVRDYVEVNRAAVSEMHRQVGDLREDEDGVAVRGLLVRHLVLPNDLAGTEEVLRFVAEEISRDTYVNLMGQYRPCYRAGDHRELGRPPSSGEMRAAFAIAARFGLNRLDGRSTARALACWG